MFRNKKLDPHFKSHFVTLSLSCSLLTVKASLSVKSGMFGHEVFQSLSSPRSYLDMAKVLVFRHFFWFVLSVVFITGATRISVFGLGYLLACFFFLLFGTQLLVKPSRTRLALWDCLIIYNVAVIISKNMLSVSIKLMVLWC